MTVKLVYQNKYNSNKYIEVHYDGYGHFSVKQFMYWAATGVKNFTGDGCFHRWRKANLLELLNDYTL